MAEGWACYATDLASEVGLLTPLEQYAETQSRVRMAARAIVDVRLHNGEIALDEAALFYQERAGMSAAAARAEAVKNSIYCYFSFELCLGCGDITIESDEHFFLGDIT